MKNEVFIEDISYEGSGVGKLDGKVVFIPKTLTGESVEFSFIKNNARFAVGKVENVLIQSEKRIDAVCPYFDICGGCDFQHCDYSYELKIKEDILKNEIRKVYDIKDIEIIPSSDRFGYRNKIKLEVKNNKIGYFKAKSHDFFEIKNCPIATKELNSALKILTGYLNENEYKYLKNLYIKQVGKKIGICFLFDKKALNLHQKFKKNEKLNDFSVFFAYGEILESDKTKVFCMQGDEKLSLIKNGFNFAVDISAFNQINDDVADKLYSYVLNLASQKRVINAYSGQGFLTAMLSRVVKFVYGIEFQSSAHASAEKLTQEINNVQNICGKVEDKLSQVLLRDKIDMIILDPAREGCQKIVLDEINSKNIQKIVYISCNFSTLTRDLRILSLNYEIENVKIFDMFPCTANMETVVTLSRKT